MAYYAAGQCPACHGPLMQTPYDDAMAGRTHLRCFNCGEHEFSSSALDDLSVPMSEAMRAALAHRIRWMRQGEVVNAAFIANATERASLPPALERIDNLVKYLATEIAPGVAVPMDPKRLRAVTGSDTAAAADWVVRQAIALAWITRDPAGHDWTLSADGWKRWDALQRSGAGSQHAFMAMEFNDPQLDIVFKAHMVPAVKQTGFDLRTTVGPHQKPGLIDNHMRVEIRTSRFVVCDLTHSNRGAYWEAGFAEGIGRPVLYTCRRDVLKSHDKHQAPHFDTNHHFIIDWDLSDIDACMQRLKDAIRVELQDAAKQSDD